MTGDLVSVRIVGKVSDIPGHENGTHSGEVVSLPRDKAQILIEAGRGALIEPEKGPSPEFKTGIEIKSEQEREPATDWLNFPKASPIEGIEQGKHTSEVIKLNDDEIERLADGVYLSSKFPEFLNTAFQKTWCGDTHILSWVCLAFANGFVTNSNEGLHLYVSGASGLGKSESVKAALSLLPEKYVINGQFSKKGFLYLSESLNPGTIVLIDDHTMQEDESELYRSFIASWRQSGIYYTVDKQISKPIKIPARIAQILANADGLAAINSDGQNESRFCNIEITRGKEDMIGIIDFIKNGSEKIPQREIDIIQKVWQKHIIEGQRDITIPFIKDIKITEGAEYKIREFKKFLSVIKAITLLRGRDVSTKEDFVEAQKLWKYLILMLDNDIPGLSKAEREVFGKLKELSNGGKRVYLSTLKSELPNLQQTNVYRALCGRNGSFSNVTGGLLAKTRGLQIDQYYNKDSGESDRIITLADNFRILNVTDTYIL